MKYISLILLFIGILGMLHQRYFAHGGWFSLSQMWHHEWFITIAFCLGIGIFIGVRWKR